MASKDDKIKQFCEVTGADNNRAQFFLDSAGWDIPAAAEMFFTSGGGEESLAHEGAAAIEALNTGPQQSGLGRGARPTSATNYRSASDDDDDADDEMIGRNILSGFGRGRGLIQPATVRPSAPPAVAAKKNTGGARIATLGSLRGKTDSHGHHHDDEDSDDEGRQGFYAGSGQQIMGPKTGKGGVSAANDPSALVRNMFEAARAGGAQVVTGGEGATPGSSAARPNASFGGQGVRLGANEQEAGRLVTERPQEGAARGVGGNQPRLFVLNMWRNGFSVDDGVLRAFDDPASQNFLTAVMRGEIPDELREQAGRGNVVHVNMEDHRHEEYKAKPAPKIQPFSGAGHMLGSPAPAVISTAAAAPAAVAPMPSSDAVKNAEQAARNAVKINENEPTTNIQFRFPDNSRLQGRFNQTSHNVGDLRAFIQAARPTDTRQFALMQAFPRVELSDETKSLKDAGLVNASVAVHYK